MYRIQNMTEAMCGAETSKRHEEVDQDICDLDQVMLTLKQLHDPVEYGTIHERHHCAALAS